MLVSVVPAYESTIIDARNEAPVILRTGPITNLDIKTQTNIHCVYPKSKQGNSPIAPGQLESHYAPSADVRINATNKKKGEIFIGFNTPNADLHLTETGDLIEAAAKLFDLLHVADKMNPISIAVAPIPNIGIGEAINERLARAAAPRN